MITTLIIVLPLITFAVGFIAGIAAWKMATNEKIELIKDDAKKAIRESSTDSYEAGYMRAYSDKTMSHAKRTADRLNAENETISILV